MNAIWENARLMELAHEAYINAAQNDCITSIYKRKDVLALANRQRIGNGLIGRPEFLSEAPLPAIDDFVELARVTPDGLRLKWSWMIFEQPAPKNPYEEMLKNINQRKIPKMKELEIEERAYIDLLNTIMLLRHTPGSINPKHGINTVGITRPIIGLDDDEEVPFYMHLAIVTVMKKLAKCMSLSLTCRRNILQYVHKSYSKAGLNADYSTEINKTIDDYLHYLNLTQTSE